MKSNTRWLTMLVSVVGFSTPSLTLAQTPSPAPPTTAPQAKDFVLTRHYTLREALYAPPVAVPLIKPAPPPGSEPAANAAGAANAAPDNEPPRYKSAEQVLIAQVLAMKAGDFAGWLQTWDADGQQKILERERTSQPSQLQVSRAQRLRQWLSSLRNATSITLMRWIVTGSYVIITYQIPVTGNAARKPPAEIPVVFHLDGGRWRATLDLEQDPVWLHYNDPRSTWEQVVR